MNGHGFLAILVITIITTIIAIYTFFSRGGWAALAVCIIAVAVIYLIDKKISRDNAEKEGAERSKEEQEENRRKQLSRELSLELLPSIEKYTHNIQMTSAIELLISYCNLINEWSHRFRVAMINTKSDQGGPFFFRTDPPFYYDGHMPEIACKYPVDWQTIDLSKFDKMIANHFAMANAVAIPEELLEKKLLFIAEFVTGHAKNLSEVITKYLEEGEEGKQQQSC